MPFPWAILISLVILGLALLIKHFVMEIVEEENVFLGVIGVFLLVYIGAALAIGTLNPVVIVNQGYLAVTE